jgi:hypothetical protein
MPLRDWSNPWGRAVDQSERPLATGRSTYTGKHAWART